MELNTEQRASLDVLADSVREHFDSIEQDVPDQSFLVGGAVRDALLGIESQDFDFVVVGPSRETMEARGFEPIEASSFPVFHDDEHEEWALARTEEKSGEGYTGFEVFTDDVTLEEDLRRRDITVNSMALRVK
jgi:tRNA nucleotidyltransferase (CCA-adding enzyme)